MSHLLHSSRSMLTTLSLHCHYFYLSNCFVHPNCVPLIVPWHHRTPSPALSWTLTLANCWSHIPLVLAPCVHCCEPMTFSIVFVVVSHDILQVSIMHTTTTTEYVYSIGWEGIFCISPPNRYHLYDTKKEVFLVSIVARRYQKSLLVSAILRQPIPISVLPGRYPRHYWYRLA
jgi:hypothetical protein